MNTAIRHTECECTVSKDNSGKLSFVYKAQDRLKKKTCNIGLGVNTNGLKIKQSLIKMW